MKSKKRAAKKPSRKPTGKRKKKQSEREIVLGVVAGIMDLLAKQCAELQLIRIEIRALRELAQLDSTMGDLVGTPKPVESMADGT